MILKRKSRYLLLESSKEISLEDKQTWVSLRDEVLKFLGENQYVEANPFLIKQVGSKKFIVRVSRGTERRVLLAFSFIKNVQGKEIGFYTLRISGTIRGLKTKSMA